MSAGWWWWWWKLSFEQYPDKRGILLGGSQAGRCIQKGIPSVLECTMVWRETRKRGSLSFCLLRVLQLTILDIVTTNM